MIETPEVTEHVSLTPEQRKKVNDAIKQVSIQMTQIDDKRSYISDTCKYVKEETGITPKVFRKMCKTYHKRNYSEVVHEDEVFQTMYESIIDTKSSGDGEE